MVAMDTTIDRNAPDAPEDGLATSGRPRTVSSGYPEIRGEDEQDVLRAPFEAGSGGDPLIHEPLSYFKVDFKEFSSEPEDWNTW